MNKALAITKAKLNGIKIPYRAYDAAKAADIPFWVLCAFLEQESNGGENIFGHDASIYRGAGKVTMTKYLAYKKARDEYSHKRMQGVGPMQLTWWEFQDAADKLGGAWVVKNNLLVGAKILATEYNNAKQYRKDETGRWRYVAYKYNGAQSYVDSIQKKFDKWKTLVG